MNANDLWCEQVVWFTSHQSVKVLSANPENGRVIVVSQPRLGYPDGEIFTVNDSDLSPTRPESVAGPPALVRNVKDLYAALDACAAYIGNVPDGDSRFCWLVYFQQKVYENLPASLRANRHGG